MTSILAEPKAGLNSNDVVTALKNAGAQDIQVLASGFISAKLPKEQFKLLESIAYIHEKQLHKRMA